MHLVLCCCPIFAVVPCAPLCGQVLDTVKVAEDEDTDSVVFRVYEALGGRGHVTFNW
jgi:hypothetical protein